MVYNSFSHLNSLNITKRMVYYSFSHLNSLNITIRMVYNSFSHLNSLNITIRMVYYSFSFCGLFEWKSICASFYRSLKSILPAIKKKGGGRFESN
jgi:hypothetical protein